MHKNNFMYGFKLYNMKIIERIYYVYILTNKNKTVLYTGITNNLEQRLKEHYDDRIGKKHLRESTIATSWFFMNSINTSMMQ